MSYDRNALRELFPMPVKKVKKQKNSRFNKLSKRAEAVNMYLHEKDSQGYYSLGYGNKVGYTEALYTNLKEVEWHIERNEGGK